MFLPKMKHWVALGLLAVVTGLAMGAPAWADDDAGRKVKSKVSPIYPELARRMNLTGTVKVQVLIGANGTVKSTKVIGGHPLLVEPAIDAVKKWRYEAGEESTQTVEFHFNNDN